MRKTLYAAFCAILLAAPLEASLRADALRHGEGGGVMLIGAAHGPGYASDRCFSGKFHCCRIYNRALTAAEIAANYAVDKARFNLP